MLLLLFGVIKLKLSEPIPSYREKKPYKVFISKFICLATKQIVYIVVVTLNSPK